MMSEVLTTAQTAELLGVSVNNLRVLKSRKADQLIEGQHWVTGDNNAVLWTSTGLETLQQLKGITGSNEAITDDVTPPLQEGITDPLQRYTPLVEALSDSVTQGLLGILDRRVGQKIRTAITTPLTPQECVTVLQDLGLKPVNLELLLPANNQQLLNQSEEN